MAKGKNEPSDYLDQLQWQAEHRRRIPIWFEPKWKYKIVYRYPQTTPFHKVIHILIWIGAVPATILIISSIVKSDQLELPGKIFFCFMVGLIVTIIFFAVQDASKDDDSKHIDS